MFNIFTRLHFPNGDNEYDVLAFNGGASYTLDIEVWDVTSSPVDRIRFRRVITASVGPISSIDSLLNNNESLDVWLHPGRQYVFRTFSDGAVSAPYGISMATVITTSPLGNTLFYFSALFFSSLTLILNLLTVKKKRFIVAPLYILLILLNFKIAPYHSYLPTQLPIYLLVIYSFYLMFRSFHEL